MLMQSMLRMMTLSLKKNVLSSLRSTPRRQLLAQYLGARASSPDASEEQNLMFARRVLLKTHPEMREAIDIACPDTRSLASEVEKTFKWVNSLPKKHTRPKKIDIARKSLRKKGMEDKDGFEECFTMMCEMFGWLQKA